MSQGLDDKFEAIQQTALDAADEVKCSQKDFLEGLKWMRDILATRIECVEEEIEKKR